MIEDKERSGVTDEDGQSSNCSDHLRLWHPSRGRANESAFLWKAPVTNLAGQSSYLLPGGHEASPEGAPGLV